MVSEQKKKHFEKLLKRNISYIIFKKIKDPRIGFVTITRIALSDDLYYAKIYISILGKPEEQKKSMEGLHSATKFIRAELSHELKQHRFIPHLSFYQDKELEKVHRIMLQMKELEKKESTGQSNGE